MITESDIRKLKKENLPNKPIRYLVVGESPPISGKYFYKPMRLNNTGCCTLQNAKGGYRPIYES